MTSRNTQKRKPGGFAHSKQKRRKVVNFHNAADRHRAVKPKRWLLQRERKQLPIFASRQNILDVIHQHTNAIIVSETGSGKTTQIPQYLHEDGFTKGGQIAVTQPRRVAAITVATRVASEMGVKLGREVGYTIRFDDTSSDATKIKYLTDGMLLREAMAGPSFKKYSVVVLDEAHERSLHTDVLFAILKGIQQKRTDLKVIIMSVTLTSEQFSSYFHNAPVLRILGRCHEVDVRYCQSPDDDYVDASVITVLQIHLKEPEGYILVFLTGQEEIESASKLLNDKVKSFPKECGNLCVLPFYASLPQRQQVKVFEPIESGKRKVILATNIAETSITINGVVCVIDCGMAKKRTFFHKTGMDTLIPTPISKSEAWQRCGRAGREQAGVCFRLYTEESFERMTDHVVPEILRTNLSQVILQIKALGIDNILSFDFMVKPKRSAVKKSMKQLHELGALNDKMGLSDLGRRMARLPLGTQSARALLASAEFGCARELLTAVAMLSVDNVWFSPSDRRKEADACKRRFAREEGDLITLLNVYEAFEESKFSKKWCFDNFLNWRALTKAKHVRHQLEQHCNRMKLTLSSCDGEYEKVLRCLVSGFFLHTARLQPDGTYLTLSDNQVVQIHPSSVLFGKKPECVIYSELVMTSKRYIRDVVRIEAKWLPELAPRFFSSSVER
eukprot:917565_1